MLKNSGIFYQELRNHAAQVRKLAKEDETVLGKLADAAETLVWLSDQARNEGWLWLETAVEGERLEKLILGKELRELILLLVDGTDLEVIEDIAMKQYFAGDYKGLEGFLYLTYLDGVHHIQIGASPYVFRKSIAAMMPEKVALKIQERKQG